MSNPEKLERKDETLETTEQAEASRILREMADQEAEGPTQEKSLARLNGAMHELEGELGKNMDKLNNGDRAMIGAQLEKLLRKLDGESFVRNIMANLTEKEREQIQKGK